MRGVLRTGVIWTLFAAANGAAASHPPKPQQQAKLKITLLVYDYAKVALQTLDDALERVRMIFAEAGVAVVPLNCTGDHYPEPCRRPLNPLTVLLRIVPAPGSGPRRDTMGYSTGQCITVEYAGVKAVAEEAGIIDYKLLGCVVAHELGHVLLGPDSHSQRGIMKARYTEDELTRMKVAPLWFLPEEAVHMRADVLSREREAGEPVAPSDVRAKR